MIITGMDIKMNLMLAALLMCSVHGYPYKEGFSNDARPFIRKVIKELMVRDLHNDIMTHTYTMDREMHENLVDELIEEELKDEEMFSLVIKFISRQHDSFLYQGYLKVHETIGKKSLGDFALFHLAYQVKKDMYRGQVLSLLPMFPLAVRSVVFSSTVCIKNRGYGEYLYAAADDLKYDPTHRNVFTWRPHSEAGKPGDWRFQHVEGNRFHIVNTMFDERFLAEGNSFNHDADRRRVFTSAGGADKGDVWALEMDGEDVFIKNVHYNEYLYALDGREYDSSRRAVLTWVPKGRDNCDSSTYQCRWFVSLC